ncbi:hypothetical protein NPIL_261881 [Nephila pilipes]|uniref:Uncharacterized protein n=1 Tax=Nephila pilipes TaxID=299642 RepID=A0A8X6TV38_NEPPI|nr:hypothetical protein NPIL_261881 [Nephila pilipes]
MCEGLHDDGFGTSNRGDWLSLSSSEKSTVSVEKNSQRNSKAFSPWNTEAESLDSLLGNFHIFFQRSIVKWVVLDSSLKRLHTLLNFHCPYFHIVLHLRITKKLSLR